MSSEICAFRFSFFDKKMLHGIARSNTDCAGMIGAGDKDDDLFAGAHVCGAREFHWVECPGWIFCAGER